MDDPDNEKVEVPCPACAEPSHSLIDLCSNCRMEKEAIELAESTAAKFAAAPKDSEYDV